MEGQVGAARSMRPGMLSFAPGGGIPFCLTAMGRDYLTSGEDQGVIP